MTKFDCIHLPSKKEQKSPAVLITPQISFDDMRLAFEKNHDVISLQKMLEQAYAINEQFTLFNLAIRTYKESDIVPWSAVFRNFWLGQSIADSREKILNYLTQHIVTNTSNPALVSGSFMLLINIQQVNRFLEEIIAVGKKVSGEEYRDFKLMLCAILLEMENFQTTRDILNNDAAVADYAAYRT